MGTWGSGNLDSDGALDEIYERSNALIEQLWRRFQKKESWEADEWDYDALFVDFEILFALEAAGVFNRQPLPTPNEVDSVRERWLAGWDAYFDGLQPKAGFKEERRAVIEETFERFRELCAKAEDERG